MSYFVTVEDTSGGQPVRRINTADTHTTVVNLTTFTVYVFRAFLVKNHRTVVGKSVPVIKRTLDRKPSGIGMDIYQQTYNSTTVLITWKPPENTSGPINVYWVCLYRPGDRDCQNLYVPTSRHPYSEYPGFMTHEALRFTVNPINNCLCLGDPSRLVNVTLPLPPEESDAPPRYLGGDGHNVTVVMKGQMARLRCTVWTNPSVIKDWLNSTTFQPLVLYNYTDRGQDDREPPTNLWLDTDAPTEPHMESFDLVIQEALPVHAGQYVCRLRNRAALILNRVTLIVDVNTDRNIVRNLRATALGSSTVKVEWDLPNTRDAIEGFVVMADGLPHHAVKRNETSGIFGGFNFFTVHKIRVQTISVGATASIAPEGSSGQVQGRIQTDEEQTEFIDVAHKDQPKLMVFIRAETSNTKYQVRVAAATINGTGPFSRWRCGHTTPENTGPDAENKSVNDLRATVTSPYEVSLTWSPPVDVAGIVFYDIIIEPLTKRSELITHTARDNESSVVFKDLTPSFVYRIKIRAVGNHVWHMPEKSLYVQTYSAKPRSPPRQLTLLIANDTVLTIIVVWKPPRYVDRNGPILYYVIIYDYEPFGEPKLAQVSPRKMFKIEGVESNRTYKIRLAAENKNGTGPYTEWESVFVPADSNAIDEPAKRQMKIDSYFFDDNQSASD